MNQKYIIAGLFLLFIILSGIWLSRTGRPLSVLILTLHKLISLGAVVFLAITVYRIHQAAPLIPAPTWNQCAHAIVIHCTLRHGRITEHHQNNARSSA